MVKFTLLKSISVFACYTVLYKGNIQIRTTVFNKVQIYPFLSKLFFSSTYTLLKKG
jgi:hypothetical protein